MEGYNSKTAGRAQTNPGLSHEGMAAFTPKAAEGDPVTLVNDGEVTFRALLDPVLCRAMQSQLDCALDLMRRLPPQQVEKNLCNLVDLIPPLEDDLLTSVDQPLKVAFDKSANRDYLLCDYNRDGDSYRSPWSNTYSPPIEEGSTPSERMRSMEIEANEAFDHYREMYYDGGVSSVYTWELDHGFAAVVLIKKVSDGGGRSATGCWDSIHVVEVQEKSSGRSAHYKLTSTAMLWLQTEKLRSGQMNLGGSVTRQMESDFAISDNSSHIGNIGKMVEDMENKIRSTLDDIYFGKTKDVVYKLRSLVPLDSLANQEMLRMDLESVLKNRAVL